MSRKVLRAFLGGLVFFSLASCGGGSVDPNEVVQPRPLPSDGGSAVEKKLAALARGHSKQNRKALIWDSRLHAAARARSKDMGVRGYFNHVNPDGFGPNWFVTQTGYRLPMQWTAFDGGNQVESILGGHVSAEAAFKMWMGSTKHVNHILARNPFYENQTRYGVGYVYVPNSRYKHYWTFISAPPEE